MWWRILFISLAYLLLGAHFLRFGQNEACIAYALAPALLFIRSTWMTRLLQLALIVSAFLVWGVSGFEYVQTRILAEAPWYRLSIIMSSVVMFTLFAAWCGNGIIDKRSQRRLFS
ncbi:hypothetical protein JK628_09555 [Shewanella sp. KX20019]|uniref:hypothetical protein n=1 Tax=Shewanella sp. KX20019 TaxID=2803864 RepID=UPI001926F5F7|nr:hypothetical protein [Shewanella sp. KX20019]QQX82026.1 hypothetical protein JK628_09555 [Shewanella sp. KX20019]